MVVASDQHLGYEKSNASSFSAFLDYVSSRNDVSSLVILGDFIDMWRRDVSGLFFEHHDALEKILEFERGGKELSVVAGNHDYHLLKLLGHQYPFTFDDKVRAQGSSISYRMVHGWEFDLAQHPIAMEALCHNMSDDAGQARSDFYNFFKTVGDKLKDLFEFHGGHQAYVDHLMTTPEIRLAPYLDDVERTALKNVEDGEILVFGHTHKPFINTAQNLVNSGSWVADADITNTFVELDGSTARLYVFKSKDSVLEIKDRLTLQ